MDTSCSNEYLTKGPWVRTVVGLTCVLAMIGAAFIIFTYVCFPDLRSKPRAILLQLSVMDFGIGCANFVGDVVNFDRFYHNGSCDSEGHLVFHETNALANGFCVAQAFFAHFCTIGSVLWTMGLSVYIYFLIVHHKKPWKAKYALWLAYVLCWGIPMLDTLWLLGSKRLGYSPYDTSGWCGPIVINPKTREPNAFLNFISYDVWIVLAMLVVPLLYFAVELYLRVELKEARDVYGESRFWDSVYILDYKFLLIPLAFTILRIWTLLYNILKIYINLEHIPNSVSVAFIILTGIGDSGQGFANGILFVFLTRKVRTTLVDKMADCKGRCKKRLANPRDSLLKVTSECSDA